MLCSNIKYISKLLKQKNYAFYAIISYIMFSKISWIVTAIDKLVKIKRLTTKIYKPYWNK